VLVHGYKISYTENKKVPFFLPSTAGHGGKRARTVRSTDAIGASSAAPAVDEERRESLMK